MINVNDVVPVNPNYIYRYEVVNSDGTSKNPAEYMYLKFSPGTLALTPTAVNRALLMAMQGFIGCTVVKQANGNVVETNSDGHTLTTVKNANGSVTYTFTANGQSITKTISKTSTGYTEVITG